uniref:Uncharacterized protein n=1 Tax=Panagrolaimus sp. ES5 TaxID=591445 RepID=A0AC34FCW0_9BILA
MHKILFIFAILILSTFTTAAPASNRTFNCYKYERNFTDVNFIDPPVEEKDVTKCDKCYSYICYSKNDQYVLGNGCREDFFQTCKLTKGMEKMIRDLSDGKKCLTALRNDAVFERCFNDYCNHGSFDSCFKRKFGKTPDEPMGPGYTYANITFTQLTTPAPTTTSISVTQSADSNHGGSDNDNENHPESNASKNSFMLSMIFFGILIFDYFM